MAIDALHAEQGDDDGGDEGRGHEVEHTLASQAFVDGLRVAFQHFVQHTLVIHFALREAFVEQVPFLFQFFKFHSAFVFTG